MMRKQCVQGCSSKTAAGMMLLVFLMVHSMHISPHQEVETEHSFDQHCIVVKKKKARMRYH